MNFEETYDVVIMGGGMAGLTLSLQLKQKDPEINILVLEMRASEAPMAAHKVGESTVELGTHYLREVLGLKDYMDEHQLPKHGLRFFFSPKHKNDIHKRVELGPRLLLPVPSHQIDRGSFENDLINISREKGNTVLLNARVSNVELGEKEHQVSFKHEGALANVNARWVVDATGRSAFLKRKLDFAKGVDHDINAVWFRVDYKIDIDEWSNDERWHAQVEPGLRYLSTVHLMDNGYWVWLIPLAGNRTSVGIVADPALHPFDGFNSKEKALDWLEQNEPQFRKELKKLEHKIIDFRVMKHFAHRSGQLFSVDRWSVPGESGQFLDPFYSPGTDFIALANGFTADLIHRDRNGEDIFLRTRFYNEAFSAMFENWLPIYHDQYPIWGCTQVMIAKIYWDWAGYWGINTLLYVNDAFTDLTFFRRISVGPKTLLSRYGELNVRMQQLFKDWAPYYTDEEEGRYTDPFDLDYLRNFHEQIVGEGGESKELTQQLKENLEVLEKVAAEVFRRANTAVNGSMVEQEVDPYTMSLTGEKLESLNGKNIAPDPEIAAEIEKIWPRKLSTSTAS